MARSRPTLRYSVGEMKGLPAKLMRRYWEIHPGNANHRDPDLERFLSTLEVDIRSHIVEKPEEGGRLAFLYDDNAIRTPPFEMFCIPVDYYFSLAHELIHWADPGDGKGATRAQRP